MKCTTLVLMGIGFLAASFASANVNPHYGSISLPPSTVRVMCKNVDDDILVVGSCDTVSDGTAPLHLEVDCEITARGLTNPSQWYGHEIMVVNHPVPSHFVSSQMLGLESEQGLSGLISHFVLHITASKDGSFTATLDTLSLQCQG
jgi:hypothetical protein